MKHLLIIVGLGIIGFLAYLALAPAARTPSKVAPKNVSATQTLAEYGQMCKAAIKDVPSFNCLDGELIPITVNGLVPASYTPNMDCDRPALLPLGESGHTGTDGQCVPYSRIFNFSDGINQVVAACRQKIIRSEASTQFDEIDVITHSVADGSTCWFQATGDGDAGLDGTKVPSPTEATPEPGYPAPADFWNSPAAVANEQPVNCGFCHDNDPFMYSPYVAQVWDMVPTDPFGWYKHIGPDFKWWPTTSLSTRDNTCVGCHRIGITFTSGQGAKEATGLVHIPNTDEWANTYPQTHWMPPGNFHSEAQWDTIYKQAVQDLLDCNEDPALPKCIVTEITGLPE
ncbi:hypothetical protein [Kordiimonas lacus]|uniref:Uncharacterized protein n=1 Tax=Kordiimonas lacus TaxID=637679 RepID=A0A1G7DRA9_9PROT|nr:hypothetical protein [Kordiimonas lacus]SDE53952.1 hypothetical protein SAMN04488071_3216 [Kordiimonas lacus]